MNGGVTELPVLSSYQARATALPWLAVYWALLAVFLAVGAVIGVDSLQGKLFGLLMAGGSAFASFSVVSAAWRLELTADTLRWRSTLGGGEVPLTELRSIRSGQGRGRLPMFGPAAWRARAFAVIDFTTGSRPVSIPVRAGFGLFAEAVRQAAPQLDVDLGDQATGYRRGS